MSGKKTWQERQLELVQARQQAQAARGDKPPVSKKEMLLKHRTTLIILGVILLMFISYGIMNAFSGGKPESVYDVLGFYPNVSAEHRPFITKIDGINRNLREWSANEQADLIVAAHVEIRNFNVPESLINLKSAQLDLIYFHYREAIRSVNHADFETARETFAQRLARAAR
jgi:hypothetical protein